MNEMRNHPTIRKGYGTTPVGCKGGSWYVEGCWGFPYLKIKPVSCLLVSWFLVFRFLGFQNILYFQMILFYILPNCHFTLFDRYWSHIQYFRDVIRRIFIMFRHPSFRKVSNNLMSKISMYLKAIFSKGVLGFVKVSWSLQRYWFLVFGAWWRVLP